MAILPFRGTWPTIAENVFIAPGAMIIGNVTLYEGVSVWYNTVIRADMSPIIIGRGTNIQDNASLHVEADAALTIGEGCSIGHNAIVHGCVLNDNVLVGMGSIIMDGAEVGSNSIIAAGAVVLENTKIEQGVIYGGVPARKIKDIPQDLIQGEIDRIANNYVQYADWFRETK